MKLIALVMLLALAGCGGSNPDAPEIVVEKPTVTPAADSGHVDAATCNATPAIPCPKEPN